MTPTRDQALDELRRLSGAGVIDCHQALEATDGDVREALAWLRRRAPVCRIRRRPQSERDGNDP